MAALIAVLLCLSAAGCQSYEPRPPDPAAHVAAWRGLRLDDPALRQELDARAAEMGRAAPSFDPADGLSLDEAQLVAQVHNPELRQARLRVGLPAADAAFAGRWSDPQFSFTLMRIEQDVPDRWVVAPSLAVPIPLSDRLDAERDRATAAWRAAVLLVQEAEWDLAWRLERTWIQWSAQRQALARTDRLLQTLGPIEEATRALADAGELLRLEADLVRIETLERRGEQARLQGRARDTEHTVRQLLGLSPEAPVAFLPTLLAPAVPHDPRPSIDGHPRMARLHAEHAAAEELLRREVAKQFPDLWIGPQSESDAGQRRFGVSGWLGLSMWNSNAQAIARAEVERELARTALETEATRLIGRRAQVDDQLASLGARRATLEDQLLPLVERQATSALRLLGLGEGSLLLLLESETRRLQAHLDRIRLQADEALALAELRFLDGPSLPAVSPLPEGLSP